MSVWAAASSTPRHGRSPHTTPAALRHGEAEATFTADAIAWCGAHGVDWALENPASSKLWQHGVVQTALGNVVHFVGHLDWCAHGGARPGLTQVATSVRALADACDRCPGESASHSHSKWVPGRRSVPQPNEWCRTVARAASGNMGPARRSPVPRLEQIRTGVDEHTLQSRTTAGRQMRRALTPPRACGRPADKLRPRRVPGRYLQTKTVKGGHRDRRDSRASWQPVAVVRCGH